MLCFSIKSECRVRDVSSKSPGCVRSGCSTSLSSGRGDSPASEKAAAEAPLRFGGVGVCGR